MDNTLLVLEQNIYAIKIVYDYIVYGLDNWPKIQHRSFLFKICLFGETALVKNNDKWKCVYSGYRIAFDEKRNVFLIISVDGNSSSHTDNQKNDFLV